jgi:hypothetical protein
MRQAGTMGVISVYRNFQNLLDYSERVGEKHTFPQIGHITVSVGFISINPYVSPVMMLGYAD